MKSKERKQENIEPICKRIHNYIYYFTDLLGQGNFSKVYKAHNQITKQSVAIKIIQLSSIKSRTLSQLLFSEIDVLKKLNHPNILKCFQVFTSKENCYIVTQLCNGGDLESQLATEQYHSQKSAKSLIKDIFSGLLYLADNHIIHRDLKVANVFIHNNQAKIADFGFSKVKKENFKDVSIGSPIYMAPEGLIKNQYGPKTDVWAFGILLYELLHGKTPYSNCQQQNQLKIEVKKPISPSKFRRGISDEIIQVIKKCLTVNVQDRPTFQELSNMPYFRKLMKNSTLITEPSRDLTNYYSLLQPAMNKQTSNNSQKLNTDKFVGNKLRSISSQKNIQKINQLTEQKIKIDKKYDNYIKMTPSQRSRQKTNQHGNLVKIISSKDNKNQLHTNKQFQNKEINSNLLSTPINTNKKNYEIFQKDINIDYKIRKTPQKFKQFLQKNIKNDYQTTKQLSNNHKKQFNTDKKQYSTALNYFTHVKNDHSPFNKQLTLHSKNKSDTKNPDQDRDFRPREFKKSSRNINIQQNKNTQTNNDISDPYHTKSIYYIPSKFLSPQRDQNIKNTTLTTHSTHSAATIKNIPNIQQDIRSTRKIQYQQQQPLKNKQRISQSEEDQQENKQQILWPTFKYKQCIGILHYCRLFFKFVTLVQQLTNKGNMTLIKKQSEKTRSTSRSIQKIKNGELKNVNQQLMYIIKQFLTNQMQVISNWVLYLIKQIKQKVDSQKIIYDTDNVYHHQKKIKEVTREYYRKYTKQILCSKHLYVSVDVVGKAISRIYSRIEEQITFNKNCPSIHNLLIMGHHLLFMLQHTQRLNKCLKTGELLQFQTNKDIEKFLGRNYEALDMHSYVLTRRKCLQSYNSLTNIKSARNTKQNQVQQKYKKRDLNYASYVIPSNSTLNLNTVNDRRKSQI